MDFTANPNVLFYDRIVSMRRTKESGEVVDRGSTEGALNSIEIRRGTGGICYVVGHCIMQQILLANIKQWPSAVSDDGRTVTLWLDDHSLGRNGYRRKFEVTFIHERLAKIFFSLFTGAIQERVGPCLSFEKMAYGGVGEHQEREGGNDNSDDDNSSSNNNNEEEREEDNGLAELVQALNDSSVVGVAQEDSNNDENDYDHFQRILEMEQNMGESQSLFHLYHPYD